MEKTRSGHKCFWHCSCLWNNGCLFCSGITSFLIILFLLFYYNRAETLPQISLSKRQRKNDWNFSAPTQIMKLYTSGQWKVAASLLVTPFRWRKIATFSRLIICQEYASCCFHVLTIGWEKFTCFMHAERNQFGLNLIESKFVLYPIFYLTLKLQPYVKISYEQH